MNILTFSSLYPNVVMPRHGVFVENRLRQLVNTGQVNASVVAPVPWFPFSSHCFGEYARFASVPKYEIRYGIAIQHPRYFLLPKVSMNLAPALMTRGALKAIKPLMAGQKNIQLIDAHYFYPDGVAAANIAELMNKPFVITARGTDINFIPRYKKPREMILSAAHKASAIISVCEALKDALINLGVEASKIHVLRNGVDLEGFSPPIERSSLREKLGFTNFTLLSVGHLIERKGHHLVIKAIKNLPDMKLVIVGDGPEYKNLKNIAHQQGVESRITFLGEIDHNNLKDYYGASDALVLASSREGWANVLLESLACGTPVVATDIWGTPEIITNSVAGILVKREPDAISDGINKLRQNYPDRKETRLYAEQFSWDDTTRALLDLFNNILTENIR